MKWICNQFGRMEAKQQHENIIIEMWIYKDMISSILYRYRSCVSIKNTNARDFSCPIDNLQTFNTEQEAQKCCEEIFNNFIFKIFMIGKKFEQQ